MVHEFSADPNKLTEKPHHSEVGLIKQRFVRASVETVEDFIEDVGRGVSWSGGVFENNHLTNSSFISQSIFALDFDENLRPQDAIQRLRKYSVQPSAYYHTFSHNEKEDKIKFRLVLFLDTVIRNKALRNWIQDGLLKLYPEADQSASDAARFYYGGDKQGFVLSEEEIPLNLLTSVLDSDKLKGGGRMYKIGNNESYHDTGHELNRNSILSNNKATVLNNGKWIPEEKEEYRQELKDQMYNRTINWEKLEERVNIFHDFMHREERLRYSELLGLAQNMA